MRSGAWSGVDRAAEGSEFESVGMWCAAAEPVERGGGGAGAVLFMREQLPSADAVAQDVETWLMENLGG